MIKFMTPALTIFDVEGKIDRKGNLALYEHLIKNNITNIVLMGSTGEFFSLNYSEKKELIDIAIEGIAGRANIIVGTSSMDVEETINLSNYAIKKGAKAVMIITPYYFKLSDKAIYEYYHYICDKIQGDVYLYNYPDITGHTISPSIVDELLTKHKNIIGYKDTVKDMSHTRELIKKIKTKYPEFEIYSGFDDNLFHNLLSGGDGCIGGLSNLYPKLFSEALNAYMGNNIAEISKYQKEIDKICDLYLIATPFIPVIKEKLFGINSDILPYIRKPLIL